MVGWRRTKTTRSISEAQCVRPPGITLDDSVSGQGRERKSPPSWEWWIPAARRRESLGYRRACQLYAYQLSGSGRGPRRWPGGCICITSSIFISISILFLIYYHIFCLFLFRVVTLPVTGKVAVRTTAPTRRSRTRQVSGHGQNQGYPCRVRRSLLAPSAGTGCHLSTGGRQSTKDGGD